jgi:hypothetical protein
VIKYKHYPLKSCKNFITILQRIDKIQLRRSGGLVHVTKRGCVFAGFEIIVSIPATGMGDEISWGLYIANFAFLVGMAAAAVMMDIPAYIFEDREMHKVVIFSLIGLAGIDARDNLQFNPSRGSTR